MSELFNKRQELMGGLDVDELAELENLVPKKQINQEVIKPAEQPNTFGQKIKNLLLAVADLL